jgi:putative tryptophan/tyrosine transport system substrate-binding protein
MKRRTFIVGLGSAAARPVVARGQQTAVPVIGFLSSQSPVGAATFVGAFKRGLAELGYVDGQNVTIEYRWAEDHLDRLKPFAADLANRRMDLIVAAGGPLSGLAVKAATKSTPLLFMSGVDPIKLGFVESLNRPGGNATGVNILITAVESKRLGLLHELFPLSATIALIVNPHSVDARAQVSDVEAAAVSVGRRLHVIEASSDSDIEAAFGSVLQARDSAALFAADPQFMNRRELIVSLAERYNIPAMYEARPFAVAGGLMSYGPDMPDVYRQVGVYAGRILKGEKPADLPVVQPTKLELVVNMNAAKALGIAIPPKILALADEVIE